MSILGATTSWVDVMLVELLSFSLRATVILAGAWAATKLLKRASAATRHLIWTSAIAGILALPILSAMLPKWNVPVVTVPAVIPTVPAAPEGNSTTASSQAPSAAGPAMTSGAMPTAVAESRATGRPMATLWLDRLADGISGRTLATFVWLILAGLMLARLIVANLRVSRWQRSAREVEDDRWLALLRRLTREYRIERPVVLLESPSTDVPVTWGIIYPVVLLPTTAQQWDDEQRAAVLTHELAHVKRFDALSQLLAQVALALLWFHPLVWMAVRRMRLEREHACDDFVLVAGARASRYADDLLGLARRLTRPTVPAAAALAMARRSELEGRLLAILDPAMKRTAVRRARVGALTAGVLLLTVPLAAFRPAVNVSTSEAHQPKVADAPHVIATDVRQPGATRPSITTPRLPSAAADASVPVPLHDDASLQTLMRRVGVVARPSMPALMGPTAVGDLPRARPDTEPPPLVDVETLIEVTRATKKMTSDYEKGLMLAMIAKRYQRSDALRDAYLDAVMTMTSDYERTKALVALLDRDSLPASSTARVLRSASLMSSDMGRGSVLKRISASTFADTTVQRAYLDVIVAMSSDMERAAAIGTLVKQRPLTAQVQLALLRAMGPISSNTEKSAVLLLFVERQGIADESVRRAFFKTAEGLTSDHEYRKVMQAVVR